MELLVHCNAHHTQQLRGSKRGARRGAAAACEAARRGLHDAGRGVSRLLLSLMLAQPELYWALASRNHRSGQECVGEADAPQALCDGVVGRLGLAREQVRGRCRGAAGGVPGEQGRRAGRLPPR